MNWPNAGIIALSVLGLGLGLYNVIAALLTHSFTVTALQLMTSLIAFGAVLLLGMALTFAQRLLDVAETRRAGVAPLSALLTIDKVALGLLIGASIANGVVVALELSRR